MVRAPYGLEKQAPGFSAENGGFEGLTPSTPRLLAAPD